MKKYCPHCNIELEKNGYVKDTGINSLSYLELIVKDERYRKHNYEINALYCPECGYLELAADLETDYTNNDQKEIMKKLNSY